MQSIKEHNLKANHNKFHYRFWLSWSVCNLSKNTIWKQITTFISHRFFRLTLYAIYQRTQSESKSQQQQESQQEKVVCMQSIKEHNLKANHNRIRCRCLGLSSVCNLSKNTIWKQITTNMPRPEYEPALYAIYQRTQSESKSQQIRPVPQPSNSVCNLSKNTIWKQITTQWRSGKDLRVCMQSIKEHNLKANHNPVWSLVELTLSVCNLSKNTIWKQITTIEFDPNEFRNLYAIYQRTQSESKSQLSICSIKW